MLHFFMYIKLHRIFMFPQNHPKRVFIDLTCPEEQKGLQKMLTAGPILQTLRLSTMISFSLNAAVAILGGALLGSMPDDCRRNELVSSAGAAAAAIAKVVCMIGAGVTQGVVASTIARRSIGAPLDPDRDFHLVARTRYKRWLWWTRLGIAITIVQFAMAVFLLLVVANDLSSAAHKSCFSGKSWRYNSIIAFLVITWVVVVMQCISGSDVLRWRSFYASHDTAWRAHYREVFDRSIREVLCCLGRVKYMSVLEDDEIYMVARLLGDLMAYRASGTGHLELLAGLALLQKNKPTSVSYDDHFEAPYMHMKEASFFHQFAEAAYTGPLLDLGRHPFLFPCVWIYRQGTFSPWTRNRRPSLEGDNCWRGHAAAFIKYVNLPPDTLRKGRVRQTKREAAYFVVVLHDLKTVVIAVRGTETPEDLITDGLCRECSLTIDDLDGLINSNKMDPSIKEKLLSSFPRFGHSGIIESARELYSQIDGKPSDGDKSELKIGGCLSSLLDEGCECHGYRIRIVGHSLGGSVAAVLGIMLYGHYPNLHVYSYGPLPCLDPILAEACSQFVTSIVCNDEFSARLSVNSIMRLRVAAVRALSSDSSANISLLPNLVRKIVHIRKDSTNNQNQLGMTPVAPVNSITVSENSNGQIHNRHLAHTIRDGVFLCGHAMSCVVHSDSNQHHSSGIENSADSFTESSNNGQRLELSMNPLEEVQASIANSSGMQSAEVYLPGLVVHLVRIKRGGHTNPILRSLIPINDKHTEYKAFVVNRERFMDIVVSPYMFLDHLPWRCHYAMQKVLESQNHRHEQPDFLSEETNV